MFATGEEEEKGGHGRTQGRGKQSSYETVEWPEESGGSGGGGIGSEELNLITASAAAQECRTRFTLGRRGGGR